MPIPSMVSTEVVFSSTRNYSSTQAYLIAHVANHCGKWGLLGHGDHFEGLVDFGSQDHLEGNFVRTHSHSSLFIITLIYKMYSILIVHASGVMGIVLY